MDKGWGIFVVALLACTGAVLTPSAIAASTADLPIAATAEQPGMEAVPMAAITKCVAARCSLSESVPVASHPVRPGALTVRIDRAGAAEISNVSASYGFRGTSRTQALPIYRQAQDLYTVVLPNPIVPGSVRVRASGPFSDDPGPEYWLRDFAIRVGQSSDRSAVPVVVNGKTPRFKVDASVSVFNARIPSHVLSGEVNSVGLTGKYVTYVTRGGKRVSSVSVAALGTNRAFSLTINLRDQNKIFRGGRLVVRGTSVSGPLLFSKQLVSMSGWLD